MTNFRKKSCRRTRTIFWRLHLWNRQFFSGTPLRDSGSLKSELSMVNIYTFLARTVKCFTRNIFIRTTAVCLISLIREIGRTFWSLRPTGILTLSGADLIGDQTPEISWRAWRIMSKGWTPSQGKNQRVLNWKIKMSQLELKSKLPSKSLLLSHVRISTHAFLRYLWGIWLSSMINLRLVWSKSMSAVSILKIAIKFGWTVGCRPRSGSVLPLSPNLPTQTQTSLDWA